MVHHHDGGGGAYAPSFPLPRYEGRSGPLREAGTAASDQHSPLIGVRDGLQTHGRSAVNNVSDTLLAPMQQAPSVPQTKAGDVARASLLAGGIMKGFAESISAYDSIVDDLNAEYEAARSNRFGVAADAGAQEGMSDREKSDARQDLIDSADRALRARLGAREAQARAELEDTGDTFAAQLNEGPTEDTMLALTLAGHLDVSETLTYIGMTLAQFNTVRGQVSSVRMVVKPSTYKNYVNLASYVRNLVAPGRMNQSIAIQQGMLMRKIMQSAWQKGWPLERRLGAFKAGKLKQADLAKFVRGLPGQNLLNGWDPGRLAMDGKGGFFSSTGRIGGFLHQSKIAGGINTIGGKALAPLAAAGGAYTVYDTFANWNERSTEERITGTVGGTGAAVSGSIATYALIAGSVTPVGAAVAVVAGTVALGVMAYKHREQIADAAKFVFDHSPAGHVWNNREAIGEEIGEKVSQAKDIAEDVGGKVKDGITGGLKKLGGLF